MLNTFFEIVTKIKSLVVPKNGYRFKLKHFKSEQTRNSLELIEKYMLLKTSLVFYINKNESDSILI